MVFSELSFEFYSIKKGKFVTVIIYSQEGILGLLNVLYLVKAYSIGGHEESL